MYLYEDREIFKNTIEDVIKNLRKLAEGEMFA
jgi:hypothetical protein